MFLKDLLVLFALARVHYNLLFCQD